MNTLKWPEQHRTWAKENGVAWLGVVFSYFQFSSVFWAGCLYTLATLLTQVNRLSASKAFAKAYPRITNQLHCERELKVHDSLCLKSNSKLKDVGCEYSNLDPVRHWSCWSPSMVNSRLATLHRPFTVCRVSMEMPH